MKKLRDGIRDFEKDALVGALRDGKSWDEAKELLPDVCPKVLDGGFKAWAHQEAGVEFAEEPAAELPEGVEGVNADVPRAAVDAHLEAGGTVALEPAEDAAPEEPAPQPAPKKGRKASKPKTAPF